VPGKQDPLLPAYVVIDESGSMGPYQADLSDGLQSLCAMLRAVELAVAARLRLTVLGFSDDVQVRLAMADLRAGSAVPRMTIRGLTNYAAVFDDLLSRIPTDVESLREQGFRVHRPVVFLLSDGRPADTARWRTPHAALTDRAYTPTAPNIVVCGIGEADAEAVLEAATSPNLAFTAVPGADLGQAIAEFFHALAASLADSALALDSESPQLVVNRPEQFTTAADAVQIREG
jgi:uncharacterized protein YegL